jgi:hypothetical protein
MPPSLTLSSLLSISHRKEPAGLHPPQYYLTAKTSAKNFARTRERWPLSSLSKRGSGALSRYCIKAKISVYGIYPFH